MSFSLPPISLGGVVVGASGTVDWTSLAQSAGYGVPTNVPYLALLNESPCGLQIQFHTGEQMSLPAGGWQTIALNANCTSLTYQVLYVLNANPIVSSLLGTWYAPGESVPDAPILGNSPIGAAVTTSPFANVLQGINQSQGVTEFDHVGIFAGPMLTPTAHGQALWLVNGDGLAGVIVDSSANTNIQGPLLANSSASVATTLGVTGATTLSSTVHAVGAVTMDAAATVGTTLGVTGAVTLNNKVTTYNNEATAGVGLPYIVAIAENVSVTGTGLTSILTYTTPNDGANHSLRVNAWCDVNSNVSGNNISLQVVYTDPRTGATNTTPFSTATSTASVSFNGATSINNSRYAMYPYMVYCKPNTVVTIQYRDPTNTPSDHVSAMIERIS